MIRKNGVRVRPQSRVNIRDVTSTLRKKLGLQDSFDFPVIEFLEKIMPLLFPGFNYEYVEKAKMGKVEGLTIPETNTIRIREDVYESALRCEGRARFTIAHEIGHYIMHKNQFPSFARVHESLPPYEDAEWQANTFAGELLMPYHLVSGKVAHEVVELCGVSFTAADYHLSKIK